MKSIILYIFIFIVISYGSLSQIDSIKINNQEKRIIRSKYIDSLIFMKKHTNTFIIKSPYSEKAETTEEITKEKKIERILIGSVDNNKLDLLIEDSLISKAISEELSDSLSISTMLIQRDFDETLFFYIEGILGNRPIAIRIKLFRENETELYITKESYLEYCLAKKKCKSPAFGDLFGCKCLNGSSKSVEYHRIDGINFHKLSGNE
jgi:hypothetical protein